jgi:SLOG cluster2
MTDQINISGVDDSLIEKNNQSLKKSNKSLNGKKIAISVSKNEDLERNGMSEQHINDISIEIARYIISNGGTALYGGDLRNEGFTKYFSELSNQYKLENDRTYRFVNYFPFPNFKEITLEVQIEFKSKQIKPEILGLPKSLKGIDVNKAYKPFDNCEDRYIYSECFKEMRIKMAKDCSARVIVGGKIGNYLGYIPGIIEEALYTLLENKPLYLVGGFGGASEKLIKLIKGKEVNELTNDFQYSTEFLKEYRDFVKDKYNYSDYEFLKKEFLKFDIEKLSELNKLSVEENEILFSSKNIHEIVHLIMKGLRNI